MSFNASGGSSYGVGSVSLSASSSMVSDFAAFAGTLTEKNRKVIGPSSDVSCDNLVTRSGALTWQNDLNEQNYQLFKMKNSTFTN